MIIPAQTLLSESACYACYGISLVDQLKLALLSRIAGGGYTMMFAGGWESGGLADGVVYYCGGDMYNSTRTGMSTYDNVSVDIPRSGTISRLWFRCRLAAGSTAEPVVHSLRINDVNDVAPITLSYDVTNVSGVNDSVRHPVIAGDKIAFKISCPTWPGGNPSGARWVAWAFIA